MRVLGYDPRRFRARNAGRPADCHRSQTMPDTSQPDIGLGSNILNRCRLTPALPALSFEGVTLD
jgi:hypothetical protein